MYDREDKATIQTQYLVDSIAQGLATLKMSSFKNVRKLT